MPAKRERACCQREVRQQLTAAATGAQLAGMTFAAGQARAAAYQAAYQAAAGGGSGNKGDKDEEGSYSDSSSDVAVERTAVDFIKS